VGAAPSCTARARSVGAFQGEGKLANVVNLISCFKNPPYLHRIENLVFRPEMLPPRPEWVPLSDMIRSRLPRWIHDLEPKISSTARERGNFDPLSLATSCAPTSSARSRGLLAPHRIPQTPCPDHLDLGLLFGSSRLRVERRPEVQCATAPTRKRSLTARRHPGRRDYCS